MAIVVKPKQPRPTNDAFSAETTDSRLRHLITLKPWYKDQ
jgi:hypothetical protein